MYPKPRHSAERFSARLHDLLEVFVGRLAIAPVCHLAEPAARRGVGCRSAILWLLFCPRNLCNTRPGGERSSSASPNLDPPSRDQDLEKCMSVFAHDTSPSWSRTSPF
jgi:hypothetical protein